MVQTNGCSAFPIAVHEGIRSVNPPGSPNDPYPDADDFFAPDNPPEYGDFIGHRPDIPLTQAREGYLYRVYNGFGSGNFGWLVWNDGISANANTLTRSLSWPGDSNDYADHGDGGQPTGGFPHVVRGYVNPDNQSDHALNIGDWVPGSTGAVNKIQVRDQLGLHMERGRMLRLIVWDQSRDPGVNGDYRISGFAVFKLHGYNLTGSQSWILAEFIRWDNSCGQVLP